MTNHWYHNEDKEGWAKEASSEEKNKGLDAEATYLGGYYPMLLNEIESQ